TRYTMLLKGSRFVVHDQDYVTGRSSAHAAGLGQKLPSLRWLTDSGWPHGTAAGSGQRRRDLRWDLALVGLADRQELGVGEGPAKERDAGGQSAVARYRQGQGGEAEVVDGARELDDAAHGRLHVGPASDVKLGDRGEGIGQHRQDGDVGIPERLV